MPLWMTFRTCLKPSLERARFLTFESKLKKLNCSILPLLKIHCKTKPRIKSCILSLNYVIWPRSEEVRCIALCNILAVNNNPLDDFAGKLLFCHENVDVYIQQGA